MLKDRLAVALSRARYAAIGAAIGAAVGGLFSRNAASSGAAVGALVGAMAGERRVSAKKRIDELRTEGETRLQDVLPRRSEEQ